MYFIILSSTSKTHRSLLPPSSFLSLLGLIASSGTCTALRETSVALPGLPWRGGWQGDRERNSGLPGAEPRLWAWVWIRAGELGIVRWRRAGEEGEPCPGTRPGTAAGMPKLLPLAVIWLDKLKITLD